jgi:redox-sensitive bicupin YhaK (pirin superfamily)
MTAAAGVVHEEKHSGAFTKRGGVLEMVQLWVNLPAREKMAKPRYQEILDRMIPVVDLPAGAGVVRVIAGDAPLRNEQRGPAKTVTPMRVWDMRLRGGGEASFDLAAGTNALLFLLHGRVQAAKSHDLKRHDCAILSREGETVTIDAVEDATVLLLNGEPIDEPVVAHGPFVMNTRAEIEQAMRDYRSGRMGRLEPVAGRVAGEM